MAGLRPVTLGIAGTGSVTHDLVCAVLNDHFEFGAPDSDGYFARSTEFDVRVLLPLTSELYTSDVDGVWQWAMRCELGYQLIADGSSNDRTGAPLDNLLHPSDLVTVRHGEVHERLVEMLAEADNPMLLLLTDEGTLNPVTQGVAAGALREGVPAYDLSRALREVGWDDLPDHEAPEPEPGLVTDPNGQVRLSLVETDSPEISLTSAELGVVSAAFCEVEALLGRLDGLRDQMPELRQALSYARSVLLPKPDADPTAKQRLEIYNEVTGQWEPAGRGRPKKDAKKRLVPSQGRSKSG